jgi:NADH-quinone oxidoreductase subunit E
MLPPELYDRLRSRIEKSDHPRELAVDVMYTVQRHYGYLSDEALCEAAELLGVTPLELEELATFYDFIYREPVGKFVIHVCDGVVCWMFHEGSVFNYLCEKLGVETGETTPDGLFTVLPTACIGYCDHAPSMIINGNFYGSLTPEKIDEILDKLRAEHCESVICR